MLVKRMQDWKESHPGGGAGWPRVVEADTAAVRAPRS